MNNFRLSYSLWSLVIPFSVVVFCAYHTRNFQLDDALIYLRYVKNFYAGHGLVYNLGEKFNGLTSPLFTYIVLAVAGLFKDLQTTIIFISGFFLLCAAILGGRVFSEDKWEGISTATVIASFGYFYSTFGMETPLFLLLIGLSLNWYKAQSGYFVIALALLIITRNEGVFLAIPMAADYLLKNRKLPEFKLLGIASIILILPFIFNFFYYGDFLPSTGNAKIGQGRSGFWGDKWIFFNLPPMVSASFFDNIAFVIFFVMFSVYGALKLIKQRVAIIALIFFILLLCFYAGFNIPNYHWYYAPFLYLLLIFFCRGIWVLGMDLLSTKAKGRGVLFFLLPLLALIYVMTNIKSFPEGKRMEAYAQIGGWIKQNTSPDETVALVEIGTVGWYADRTIIDILGLVNKYNADYIGKKDLWGWLIHYQPDYILRHDPFMVFEEPIKVLETSGAYTPANEFKFPTYVLLKNSHKYSDTEIANYARTLSLK